MQHENADYPDMPTELRKAAWEILKLLECAARAAKDVAAKRPSESGIYPIAVLFDANGNLMGETSGQAIVTTLPLDVVALKDGAVRFDLNDGVNQLRSPAESAAFLATSLSGYKRLRASGQLDAPLKVGERRVAHTVGQLNDCLERLNAPKGKKRRA